MPITFEIQTNKPNQVCKLKKDLYGLKQPSKNGMKKFTSHSFTRIMFKHTEITLFLPNKTTIHSISS